MLRVKQVALTQGQFAVVDDKDYDAVAQFRWRAIKNRYTYYAMRDVMRDGRRSSQYMHTLIAGFNQTDHRNGNGLDNRRRNLRPASNAENHRNARRSTANTSGYKGIDWEKRRSKWRVRVRDGRRQVTIGRYDDLADAVTARREAAARLHGEFANDG